MCVQMKKDRREVSQVCHLSFERCQRIAVQAVLEMSTLFHTLFKTESNYSSERREIPNRKHGKGCSVFPWQSPPKGGVREVCILHSQNSRIVAFQNLQEFRASRHFFLSRLLVAQTSEGKNDYLHGQLGPGLTHMCIHLFNLYHLLSQSACPCRRHQRGRFDPWVRKIPWRRRWQPAPVFLPGKSHGERSLAGYCPWSPQRARPLVTKQQQRNVSPLAKCLATPWNTDSFSQVVSCTARRMPQQVQSNVGEALETQLKSLTCELLVNSLSTLLEKRLSLRGCFPTVVVQGYPMWFSPHLLQNYQQKQVSMHTLFHF